MCVCVRVCAENSYCTLARRTVSVHLCALARTHKSKRVDVAFEQVTAANGHKHMMPRQRAAAPTRLLLRPDPRRPPAVGAPGKRLGLPSQASSLGLQRACLSQLATRTRPTHQRTPPPPDQPRISYECAALGRRLRPPPFPVAMLRAR